MRGILHMAKNFDFLFRETRHSASAHSSRRTGNTSCMSRPSRHRLRCIIPFLTKNFSVKRCHLLRLVRMRQWDVHQYYPSAGFSRAACNVFFNQRAEPYLFGLCRSDGEIRATKRHRRLEGSLQVHAVILSGYTETRRRSQSGSCGFATAKRIGTGGTKTGEKKRYRHRS